MFPKVPADEEITEIGEFMEVEKHVTGTNLPYFADGRSPPAGEGICFENFCDGVCAKIAQLVNS